MSSIIHICMAPVLKSTSAWPEDIAKAFDAGVDLCDRDDGGDKLKWTKDPKTGQDVTISPVHAPMSVRGDDLLVAWWREGYWLRYGSLIMTTQKDVDGWIVGLTKKAVARDLPSTQETDE